MNLVQLSIESARLMRSQHEHQLDPLNPQHNRQAASQLHQVPFALLYLIFQNHLLPSLPLENSKRLFPARKHQQDGAMEHMGTLPNLQRDKCDITSNLIITAGFTTDSHQASFFFFFHFHFNISGTFYPLGCPQGQLVKG